MKLPEGAVRAASWQNTERARMDACGQLLVNVTAYSVSVLGGAVVTFGWSSILHWKLSQDLKSGDEAGTPKRLLWVPAMLGVFERTLITTFVLFMPIAVGPFVGAWISIKAVGGWGLFKNPSEYNRALFMIGLLGSAMSVLWAVIVGLLARPVPIGN